MRIRKDKTLILIGSIYFISFLLTNLVFARINITYDTNSVLINNSVTKLKKVIEDVKSHDIWHPAETGIFVLSSRTKPSNKYLLRVIKRNIKEIRKEGFKIHREKKNMIFVLATNETGCAYGLQDLTEQLRFNPKLSSIKEKTINPAFGFRAIKFNLPWSPYRPGPATDLHIETCRDLKFWKSFLDMMVENRFNVISLWNTHPFPYMIRAHNYPQATPFNDEELAIWRHFWKELFRMAKDRGLETYLVNWNIVVSPQFAEAYGADVHNDRSELVKKYTRESVTQVINEYKDLTGLGVTLADWMGNWGNKGKMTPTEREDWIEDTFVAGMKAANRPVKFIHRAVLAGDPMEMRRVIDNANLPEQTIVEVKFNWSHGHSTPRLSLTHSNDSGTIMRGFWDPKPNSYFIAWMIRNEDFFILRWGQPDFIRQHIAVNSKDYVGGYFIGSEGYIPAKDYSHKPDNHVTWDYAFEKQWLLYKLWGRLLYDPNTPDKIFSAEFNRRYGGDVGDTFLKAYALASCMPLRLASFHRSTWDYTLYSEGFLAPVETGYDDKVSPFISIDELIQHQTLDPTYMSIPDYVDSILGDKQIEQSLLTPMELADDLEKDGNKALELVESLRNKTTRNVDTFDCEIEDVQAWAYLSLYFADKLRAGIALETFRKTKTKEQQTKSITLLESAAGHWAQLVEVTKQHYNPIPAVQLSRSQNNPNAVFSWQRYSDQVKQDIQIAKAAK